MVIRYSIFSFILLFGATADADVWRWIDAAGNTHYVDTLTPIYTWVDEFGNAHYSDAPDHEDAVAVEFVWHSSESLEDLQTQQAQESTAEGTDAYYCKRAKEAYEAYLNAPQLYRTDENGQRVILSEEEAAKTIADTRVKIGEYCGDASQQVSDL